LIKVGEQVIHATEGNARAKRVMRALGGSIRAKSSKISRYRTGDAVPIIVLQG